MNFEALAISVASVLGIVAGIMLLGRWWAGFTAKRFVDRIIRKMPLDGTKEPSKLMPEGLYIVEVSDSGISCSRPDKTVERVTWDDLQCVDVVNTDEGPFFPDVFWVLHGSNSGCVIPQGSTGERQLLERLQKLPGFDNESLIKAMSVTPNKRSICWRRSASSVERKHPAEPTPQFLVVRRSSLLVKFLSVRGPARCRGGRTADA